MEIQAYVKAESFDEKWKVIINLFLRKELLKSDYLFAQQPHFMLRIESNQLLIGSKL